MLLEADRKRAALSDLTTAIARDAAAHDADGSFPTAAFAELARRGLLEAPPVGAEEMRPLLRLLAAVGRGDLSVGRIFEGHVNAVWLVRRFGTPAQVRELAGAGGTLGVWNTDRAAEALRRLGAGAVPRSFLGLPDAAMPAPGTPAYAKALGVILDALDAALVVPPWRRDPHCDTRPQVLDYAIWFDEIGVPGDPPRPGEAEAVALDVSPALKRAALRPHPSQRGELVLDDSGGFVLGPETILCLTGPEEVCW